MSTDRGALDLPPAVIAPLGGSAGTAPGAGRRPWRRRPSAGQLLGGTGWYVTALLVASIMVVPVLWMVTIALKEDAAVFRVPPELIPSSFRWQNFVDGPRLVDFWRLLFNSVVITVLSVVGGVLSAMLAGYALARIRFPGREIWFSLFVGSMLLPPIVAVIPLFELYRAIGWYDTWLPLIVPAWFGGNPLFIFLARQYFRALPYSIDEAAKVDGAGHLRTFVSIMLPLTRPAWITMAILAFQFSWNDYLNPLVFLNDSDKWPLSLGMASFVSAFAGQTPDWNLYMAANLLYMVPPLLLFFVAQRYFIQGLTSLGTVSQR